MNGTGIAFHPGMEMEMSLGDAGSPVFEALQAVEPAQATAELTRLTELLHQQGIDSLDLNRAWDAFKRLLDRRGYYVDTPTRLAASLTEIDAVGAGFDLYDLAKSLARYDAVRRKCRRLPESPGLPELKRFTPACNCSTRRKGKSHA